LSDLPPGWAEATVADVASAMFDGPFGSALKTSDYTSDGVRVARLENIGHLRFRDELTSYVAQEKFDALVRHTLRAQDVLFSSFVDKQTRVCLVPDALDGRMINKADCFCVRPDRSACDPSWLAYALAAPASYETFSGAVRGVTRPRIGLRDLAAFSLGLPPLAEQRRIVAKLDALIARTGRARADLDRVPALASRYKSAVLSAALGGELTKDVAATPFPEATVGDVLVSTFYGPRFAKDAYDPEGIPTLRTTDFSEWGRVVTRDPPRVHVSEKEMGKWGLVDGDVLVTRTGSIGKCAVYEAEMGPALPSAYLIRTRFDLDRILPRFALFVLLSPEGQTQLGSGITAVTQPNINAGVIERLRLPLPGMDVQKAVVARVDALFAEIDRLVAEAAAARRLLDRLDQAILAKAFRGELVPQDPADEPASVLLDRIRAERAAAPAKGRRGRRAA